MNLVQDSSDVVFVDFDYTLLSSNSTELFIASCKPALVVGTIEFFVRSCIPWKFSGIKHCYRLRDYICVLLIAILTPWNILSWKKNAPAIFSRLSTVDIIDEIRSIDRSRLIIISFGMRFVIRALLAKSTLSDALLVATPVLVPLNYFRHGKLHVAIKAVGEARTRASTLITDSKDDEDLLSYCSNDILIPQQGISFHARERLYIPLRYFSNVKYGRSYMIDQLLLVDLVVCILSLSTGFSSLVHYLIVCPMFILSLNCIYEIGYFENDMYAATTEATPVLSDSVERYRHYPIAVGSWVWATIFAGVGFALAIELTTLTPSMALPAAIGWAAALVAIRATFFVYNRLSPHRRTLVYPLLQALKYGSIFFVFRATVLGTILTISQIATLWTNYLIYRFGGSNASFGRDLFRTMFFIIGAALLALGSLPHATGSLVTAATPGNLFCFAAVLVWSVFRAGKVELMRQVKRR